MAEKQFDTVEDDEWDSFGLFSEEDDEWEEDEEEIDDDYRNEDWFIPPSKHRAQKTSYKYARDAVKCFSKLEKNGRIFSFVSGRFIFGDLIEGMFDTYQVHTKKLTVATLSLSEDNIDSFKNLFEGGFIDSFTLHVSDYFYSHERKKEGLVPYLYQVFDGYDFQLVVSSNHTKVCFFEIDNSGRTSNIVMYGSANLRSSDCIEQLTIEDSKELLDFNRDFFDKIEEEYKTIDKPLRGNKLWQVVAVEQAVEEEVDLEQAEEVHL